MHFSLKDLLYLDWRMRLIPKFLSALILLFQTALKREDIKIYLFILIIILLFFKFIYFDFTNVLLINMVTLCLVNFFVLRLSLKENFRLFFTKVFFGKSTMGSIRELGRIFRSTSCMHLIREYVQQAHVIDGHLYHAARCDYDSPLRRSCWGFVKSSLMHCSPYPRSRLTMTMQPEDGRGTNDISGGRTRQEGKRGARVEDVFSWVSIFGRLCNQYTRVRTKKR